jgi:hypothetical protein
MAVGSTCFRFVSDRVSLGSFPTERRLCVAVERPGRRQDPRKSQEQKIHRAIGCTMVLWTRPPDPVCFGTISPKS